MFDDFVEHVGAPSADRLPAIGYQGFEPQSGLSTSDAVPAAAASRSTQSTAPIFELGRVEFPEGIPASIVSVAVSSDVLAVAFTNNQIYILEMQKAEQIIRVEIPSKPSDPPLNKIFLDPSGKHLLINSQQGVSWYWAWGWKKPKPLKRFNGHKLIIDSVGWNRLSSTSPRAAASTGEILLGTRSGSIYEACLDAEDDFFKPQERFVRFLHSFSEKQPITGIVFEYFPPADASKCLVAAATASRIYQFVGLSTRRSGEGSDTFGPLFAKYKELSPETRELPGQLASSMLRLWNANPTHVDSLPSVICWSTSQGLYHGKLNFNSTTNDFIDGAQLLPYPLSRTHHKPNFSSVEPIAFTATKFHFVFLFRDRLAAVSKLDQHLAHEELLLLNPNEKVLGIAVDPTRSTYWVYTNTSMFELLVANEDRDVWSAYLQQNDFAQALLYAKTSVQRETIFASEAEAHFRAGRLIQAAQSYAQSSKSFEEVVLKFASDEGREAMRHYVGTRLEKTRRSDVAIRMMLATWLVELYLNKYNELEDAITAGAVAQNVDNFILEKKIVDAEFKEFLHTNAASLDKSIVYSLMRSHGRSEVYLHFAGLIGDHETVLEYWVLEEDWEQAMHILRRENNTELYYKYSPVLLRNRPEDIVDAWLKLPMLDHQRLLPCLLQCLQELDNKRQTAQTIRYLENIIFEKQIQSSQLHNLLITLYATSNDTNEAPLLRYLSNVTVDLATGRPGYDLDYALRLCTQYGRIQACVRIYSQMGFWEECVDLALSRGELELAKQNADMPNDDTPLRKKLWMKIAKYVVQERNDIMSAMRFLDTAEVLKIEDILPLFPDFVVIDDFKEEICGALEGYSKHIESLKVDMDAATRNVEAIKADTADLNRRFITVDTNERCLVCSMPLFARQFYVFPCQHTFHADCLIILLKEAQPPHVLRKMVALQTELLKGSNTAASERPATPETPGMTNTASRNLLSSNFGVPNGRSVVNVAGSFGRGVLNAGDRLRDLIVPESLASAVGGWTGGDNKATLNREARNKEAVREQLHELLSSHCPLCESVVTTLDKAFIRPGEADGSWDI